jgi:hypothetical protein
MAVDTVFFYISGHGFGHAVRQIAVINALLGLAGERVRVFVRTSAAPWLFTKTIRGSAVMLPGETDTGVVQIDSLRLDARATIEVASLFYDVLPGRVEAEASLLDKYDARLVVADAPPLACAAAREAGIPSFVCSNFTWDWIYRDYRDASPAAPQVIALAGELYTHAAAGWRLPMHGGFETFDTIVDVPLVARHARSDRSRTDVRSALRLPEEGLLALVSFGGYGLRDMPLDTVDCTESWGVVVTSRDTAGAQLPKGIHAVPEHQLYDLGLRYEDLVRAVDVVISKPGYGIISDCIANGASLLYTSRGRFAEYDVLVREMPRYLRCGYIDTARLLEGRWKDALDAVANGAAPAEQLRTDGADVVARLILERL